jgi:Spy/CpxP family protein refolding chaperone
VFRFNLGALALVAALAAPLAASAQTQPAPPAAPAAGASAAPGAQPEHHHRHRSGFARALRGLNLTDAQKQQIAAIMKTARENAAKDPKMADPQTRRANTLAVRQQIDGVLTPDQRAQLKVNLQRERSNAKPANGPAPAASPQ